MLTNKHKFNRPRYCHHCADYHEHDEPCPRRYSNKPTKQSNARNENARERTKGAAGSGN